jgi:hypothetical protein
MDRGVGNGAKLSFDTWAKSPTRRCPRVDASDCDFAHPTDWNTLKDEITV